MPALLDWEERFKAGQSLVPQFPLNEERAALAVSTFGDLRVPDMHGQPYLRDVCGEWFLDVVRALFGSWDEAEGRRTIREVFVCVPKKNSKTSYGAALMLTALILNDRPNAEYLLVAPTQVIAGMAFRQVAGAIRADYELEALFNISAHQKTITNRLTNSNLVVKSTDTGSITGSKATAVLIDETHAFTSRSQAKEEFTQLRGSLAARPDGFLFQTTTQSMKPPSGVFLNELRNARLVRDGKRRLPILPVLYEWPAAWVTEERWRDPTTWPLVNPNYGKSVEPEFLEGEYARAVDEGEEELRLFASQYLNVEVGTAGLDDSWDGARFWDQAAGAFDLDDLLQMSEVVTVGIDAGGLSDLYGIAVMGRDRATQKWLLWARAWCHQSALVGNKQYADALKGFARDGDLTILEEGERKRDVTEAADIVRQVADEGKLPTENAVGIDSHGIAAIIDSLAAVGIEGRRVVGVAQGWRLTAAIQGMERKLADGSLVHSCAPLMQWCVRAARVERTKNAVHITRAQARGKIDPLIASFNAFHLMALRPQTGKTPSIYNERPEIQTVMR